MSQINAIIENIISDRGVILADNILSHKEKTAPYVDELFGNENYSSQILEMGAGMMLSVKTGK